MIPYLKPRLLLRLACPQIDLYAIPNIALPVDLSIAAFELGLRVLRRLSAYLVCVKNLSEAVPLLRFGQTRLLRAFVG